MTAAVAEKLDPAETPAPGGKGSRKPPVSEAGGAAGREPPVIRPDLVSVNRGGTVWTEWHVRFPEDGILDDLKEPGIWKLVQGDRFKAFRTLDELRIVAFDQSWIARCIVAHAGRDHAVLSKPQIVSMPPRRENLYQDDLYRVAFVGNGYTVIRKKDGQRVTGVVASAAVAQFDLQNLYPRMGA
jgi:hypothetical protein